MAIFNSSCFICQIIKSVYNFIDNYFAGNNSKNSDYNKNILCHFNAAPFENPPESRDGKRPEPVNQEQLKTPPIKSKTPSGRGRSPAKPKTPPTQDEINMLIDEEMSMFPEQK